MRSAGTPSGPHRCLDRRLGLRPRKSARPATPSRSRRYLHLITSLLDAGCVVVADDHAGHGKTAMESGFWVDTGDDGAATAVEDEASLMAVARADYPDLPYVIFGTRGDR